MTLILRELSEADEAAFLSGLKAWDNNDPSWHSFIWKPGMEYSQMLAQLKNESQGVELKPGRVPATMYYGFVNGEIIGRLQIRHSLTEYLLKRGGHIGYAVAPPYRGKGYATKMLAQGIEKARALGIREILLTCAENNLPSCKTIEHCQGQLENTVWDEIDEEMVRRYWIK